MESGILNHIFKKSDLDVVYITLKQFREWTEDVLERRLGFKYTVYTQPTISKNLINLTIDETTMTNESYIVAKEFLACETEIDRVTMIFEMSSSRKERRKEYRYKILVDDLEGFYLIRKLKKW